MRSNLAGQRGVWLSPVRLYSLAFLGYEESTHKSRRRRERHAMTSETITEKFGTTALHNNRC